MTEINTMAKVTDEIKGDDLIVEVKNTTSEEISGEISFPKTGSASTPFWLKPGELVEAKRNMKGWAYPSYKIEYSGRTFSGTSERGKFKELLPLM